MEEMRLLGDDHDSGKTSPTIPLKNHLIKFIQSGQIAFFLDFINCTLSVTCVSLYIASTYNPSYFAQPKYSHWYPILLLISHFYFLIEYLLKLYIQKSILKHIFSLSNIFEMASIFPFIIIFFTVEEFYSFWVFFSRMLDLLRISILFRLLKYTESDLSRELSKILIGGKHALFFIILF